jgi:predicted amidohydrolase YtcJ
LLLCKLEKRLTVEEALRLYIRNGAYNGFEEKVKGSIASGKLAEMIVVDPDLLTAPSDELKDVKARQTCVHGKLVCDGSTPRQTAAAKEQ